MPPGFPMPSLCAAPVTPFSIARPSGWQPAFAAAALLWNLMALLGALANYGDARLASTHATFGMTLLRFVLQQLPLTALSLILALGFHRVELKRPLFFRLALAYLGALLVFVPLLCAWQSAMDVLLRGKALAAPLALLARQSALTWWFDALMLSIAFGAHMAYSAWRHAHAETLAWQCTRQANLALRLRLLQGQLEPYFLASALAGIGKLNRSGQRALATRALARLSDLLRYALRASRSDWQSVADEVQFLRDYVDLQCLCHDAGPLVQWRLEQCDWSDYRCPPLLLFPMIEQALDACRHARMPSLPVTIEIVRQVLAGAERVRVDVCFPHGTGRGEALADMRVRLAMLFDGAARLDTQVDGGVTRIRLAYPVSRQDD